MGYWRLFDLGSGKVLLLKAGELVITLPFERLEKLAKDEVLLVVLAKFVENGDAFAERNRSDEAVPGNDWDGDIAENDDDEVLVGARPPDDWEGVIRKAWLPPMVAVEEFILRSFPARNGELSTCCCCGKGLKGPPAGCAIGGPRAGVVPDRLLLPEGPNERLLAKFAKLLSKSPVRTTLAAEDPIIIF